MPTLPKPVSTTITAEQLLDAIAPRIAAGRLRTVNLAVAARLAGVPLEAVRACYGERQALLVALHQRYIRQILDRVLAESNEKVAGNERLRDSITGFLDACLQQRDVRLQLLDMEARHPALARAAAARRQSFLIMLGMELRACGMTQPDPAARLLRTLVEEVSRVEGDSGKLNEPARTLLWRFIALCLER